MQHSTNHLTRLRLWVGLLLPMALVCALFAAAAAAAPPARWVGTFSTAHNAAYKGPGLGGAPTAFPDREAVEQTVRNIVRATIGGEQLRVRLSNVYGTQPVTFGSAYVGLRDVGPRLVAGSNRPLTVDGQQRFTIPAGEERYTDPVDLPVSAQEELAVSLYVEGHSGPISNHQLAMKTSFASKPGTGNFAEHESGEGLSETVLGWPWIDGIDVVAAPEAGTVVALGDSITDGAWSTHDADDKWPDILARRLNDRAGGPIRSVVNEGISGNRVTQDVDGSGEAAVNRLDRDVLSQSGVSHVIVFEGINDLNKGVSAEELIAGLHDIVTRGQDRCLKVLGATIAPAGMSGEEEAHRQAVNDWIRNSGVYDGVFDFDAALRDALVPSQMHPAYRSDGTHPNPLGMRAIAEAVDLALLETPATSPLGSSGRCRELTSTAR